MDKELLVKSGQALVSRLDHTRVKPRAAIWVHNPENDIWKLWIVPAADMTDKHEFYRIMSEVIAEHRGELHDLDISATEFVKESHPAMQGLKLFMHMPGLGSAYVTNNTVNGFFLPDGIILRMAL